MKDHHNTLATNQTSAVCPADDRLHPKNPACNRPLPLLAWLALTGLLLCGHHPNAEAYTISLQPGPNLVANHFNHTPNNGLNNVLVTTVPNVLAAYFWDVPNQQFAFADYNAAGGAWVNNAVLNPGSGAVCYSSSASALNINVTGTPAAGNSVTLVPGQFQLLGNAAASAGTVPGSYPTIVGNAPPASGTTWLMRWNVTTKKYISSRYVGTTWSPGTPSVPVGQSVFVANIAAGLPAPNVVGAERSCDTIGDFIRVKFDADVDPLRAAVAANFSITGGTVSITAAEPEFDLGSFGPMPRPKVRSVRLRATGLATPALLTCTAPGVTGMGGTPVNSLSSATVQTALTVVKASMDCDSGTLCLTFNQTVDNTAANFAGNYSVAWTDPAASTSGSLSILNISHFVATNNLTQSDRVCLQLSAVPAGNLFFTVSLNSATASPLVCVCGAPLAVTPVFTVSTTCNPLVEGRVFRHQSAPDCAQDLGTGLYGVVPNEYGLVGRAVKLDDGLDTYYGVTGADGDFHVRAPAGSYTLELVPKSGWIQRCPASGGIPVTVVAGTTAGGNLFSSEPNPSVQDLSVYLYPRYVHDPGPADTRLYSSPCCGQPMTLVASYQNDGTEVILNATVKITLPPASLAVLTTTASSPAVAAPTSSGGVLTWIIPYLLPGQRGSVEAGIMITCPGGSVQTITAAATITTPAGDPTPGNNTSAYSKQTLCSHDPNDKTVVPRGCGPEGFVPVGTEFEYLVQFQNTGNGPAYRVVLRDFLDPDLDLNTVQLLGGSHPYVFTVDPNTREMVWAMEDINLPGESYDEPHSHGFVRYKVRHNAGASVGTIITNQAAIYFDVNAPVLTAITTNTLDSGTMPVAAFTASTTTPAAGLPVNFTYTGGTGGVSYLWNFGPNATPATSAAQNPTGIIYNTTGAQLPTLTVSYGGCDSDPAVMLLNVIAPVSPRLNIQRNGNDVVLTWSDATFRLQATTNLRPSVIWEDVAGASPLTLPVEPGARFFRLVSP